MNQAKWLTIHLLLIICGGIRVARADNEASLSIGEGEKLPLIWPTISSDKTYRIFYQVQVAESKERIAVEEWASFNDHLFRLDLISGKNRVTYLTNGQTNEIFRYEPFDCEQIDSKSPEFGILSDLMKGYRLGDDKDNSPLAFGIGPLWLKARLAAKKVHYIQNSEPDYRRYKFFKDYDSYDVSFDEDGSPFNLRFFFRPGEAQFVEAIEWLNRPRKEGENPKVMARARIVWENMHSFDRSAFDLPIGYGCQRRGKVDKHADFNLALDLLHDYLPNQAVFEIVASKPLDSDGNSWSNYRSLLHLMRGSMELNGQKHDYYVSRTQARDSSTLELKKVKKVWSSFGDDPNHALVYTIDEKTGDCQVDQHYVKELIQLPLPIEDKQGLGSLSKMFMSLELSFITGLFNDHVDQSKDQEGGYHLIRETIKPLGLPRMSRFDIREAYYEKTAENYEVKGKDGNIIWSGPIGIVKKLDSLNMYINEAKTKTILRHYHSAVTLLFYSDDRKSLVYKLTINLLDNDELDVGLMIKQMDVGACFDEKDKEDMIVRYPLESQKMAEGLAFISDIVQERFLLNMLASTPLLPFQLSDVGLTVNPFFLNIKFTLLDLPLTQVYRKAINQQLIIPPKKNKDEKSSVIQLLASSADRCAESCDHYRCYMFSYQRQTLHCRLALKSGNSTTEFNINSELYIYQPLNAGPSWLKYEPSGGRRHMRPEQIHQLLSQILDTEDSENKDSDPATDYLVVPMRIRLESNMIPSLASDANAPDYIELRPEAIVSDMDTFNELINEQPSNWEAKQSEENSGSMVRVNGDGPRLTVQYKILLEGRRFSEGRQEFEHLGADECAKLCENSDCRSFSYCTLSKVCVLTDLHDSKSIQAASKADEECSISALDYLSKFETFGLVPSPILVKKTVRGLDLVEDCANVCMEERGFNCESFHFCKWIKQDQSDTHPNSCYMHQTHVQEAAIPGSGILFVNPITQLNRPKSVECEFFSRSYLNHFDQYYGKQLKYESSQGLSMDAEPSTELVVGLGSEDCAAKCIRESGLAFHVCQDPHDSLTLVCEIAKQKVEKTNLVPKDRCTSFVLSDKSQLNLRKARLLADKPDREALSDDQEPDQAKEEVVDKEEAEELEHDLNLNALDWFWSLEKGRLVSKSHWFAKLISLLFGGLAGIGCALAWKSRDSFYNHATGMQSYLRQRF